MPSSTIEAGRWRPDPFAPDILAGCRQAMAGATHDGVFVRPEAAAFGSCKSVSIDYAVMERHDKVAMMGFDGMWSDVGSWNAIAELTPGPRFTGGGFSLWRNSYVMIPDGCQHRFKKLLQVAACQ